MKWFMPPTPASGSRMRGESVLAFMDRFGDKIYNSYNATEAGQISVASPGDLRHAPDTAGRPVAGTRVRLVDDDGKDVPAGEGVSYGHHWQAPVDTRIGLVPAGYADGVPRHASSGVTPGNAGTPLWTAGRRVPLVGRVCMDQVLVDLGPGAGHDGGEDQRLVGAAAIHLLPDQHLLQSVKVL